MSTRSNVKGILTKDSDRRRILKTTYFKHNNCTVISGTKLSFFLFNARCKTSKHVCVSLNNSVSFAKICVKQIYDRVNCDQAQKYSSHSTADTHVPNISLHSASHLFVLFDDAVNCKRLSSIAICE